MGNGDVETVPGKLDLDKAESLILKTKGAFIEDGALEIFLGIQWTLSSIKQLVEVYAADLVPMFTVFFYAGMILALVGFSFWQIARFNIAGTVAPKPWMFLGLAAMGIIILGEINHVYITPLISGLYLCGLGWYFTRLPRFKLYTVWVIISFMLSAWIHQTWLSDSEWSVIPYAMKIFKEGSWFDDGSRILDISFLTGSVSMLVLGSITMAGYYRDHMAGKVIQTWRGIFTGKSDSGNGEVTSDAELQEMKAEHNKMMEVTFGHGIPDLIVGILSCFMFLYVISRGPDLKLLSVGVSVFAVLLVAVLIYQWRKLLKQADLKARAVTTQYSRRYIMIGFFVLTCIMVILTLSSNIERAGNEVILPWEFFIPAVVVPIAFVVINGVKRFWYYAIWAVVSIVLAWVGTLFEPSLLYDQPYLNFSILYPIPYFFAGGYLLVNYLIEHASAKEGRS